MLDLCLFCFIKLQFVVILASFSWNSIQYVEDLVGMVLFTLNCEKITTRFGIN
jgi:hypothetical protein